jgi:hypothetical protein
VHATGGARAWRRPAAEPAGLRLGQANDDHEVAADRLARQALPGGAAGPLAPAPAPAPPPAPPRRIEPESGGLEATIAAAGQEARELPAPQRDFFAPRFGHRFDGVRIHAGPAAATAATAARAQAFTLGRDIYFGEGQYRPDSTAGRHLLAHELAHTLQDRPNVVARRALDTSFDLPESDPGASATLGRDDSDPVLDELATLVQVGPSEGNGPARERFRQLPPDRQSDAMASLRTRLPAADRGKVAALDDGTRNDAQSQAASPNPNAKPELRAGATAPAPVQAISAPAEAPAAPAGSP